MPSAGTVGWCATLAHHRGLVFPVLIVASVLIWVAPLPPMLMAPLLACHITMAVGLLLMTIYFPPRGSQQNRSLPSQSLSLPTQAAEPVFKREYCPGSASAIAAPSLAELARQGESIQTMLKQLGLKSKLPWESDARSPHNEQDVLPATLKVVRDQLHEIEVPAEIAREWIFRLQADGTPAQWKDPMTTTAMLRALVEQQFFTGGPIRLQAGKQKVVALVGATGVGKTTTIAKLAANFRLRDHLTVGLVTVDSYRIAALEPLRTYAEILDLPMQVVTNPLEMRQALANLAGLDLVLIDTAGRSPRDEMQIQELKHLLMEARVDEVHLVLSLTSRLQSWLASVEKVAPVNPTSLILTQLDRAANLGNLLALSREVEFPISYLTTGEDVPHDIEPASAERLARSILGRFEIFS